MSILDNDMYKFTMGQYILHRFPKVHVKYKFVFRNQDIVSNNSDLVTRHTMNNIYNLVNDIKDSINSTINYMNNKDDVNMLSFIKSKNGNRLFKEDYINFLKKITFNKEDICKLDYTSKGDIELEISGLWSRTVYYEVPFLAAISSVISTRLSSKSDMSSRYNMLKWLIDTEGIKIADFGTRRRSSLEDHENMIKTLGRRLIGTSNVMLALKYNMTPIGTMAHELFQASQAFVHPLDSQIFTLNEWSDEYDGDLGIVLSDTLGFGKFKKDFSLKFAKLFDGIRQDSGDPYEVGDSIIKHYENLGINPKHKSYICSDGLNNNTDIKNIYRYFNRKINISFGIGTFLTNIYTTPPQIVIKMYECEGRPVAKVSDNPAKIMCNDDLYKNYILNAVNT